VVMKGAFADNIFKPCSSAVTCGSPGLMCRDVVGTTAPYHDRCVFNLMSVCTRLCRYVPVYIYLYVTA
jgi:hypothetical protein